VNANQRTILVRRAVPAGVLLVAVALTGCGPRVGGPSAYEQEKAAQQKVADSLASQGMKTTQKHYPQGQAWAVDMTGMTITDDQIRKLKKLGRITELNLSKSTITDDQLGQINDQEIGALVLKLDLSHTSITDAGLEKLTKFMLLNNLNLTDTKVTPAGIAQLKKSRTANPNYRFKNLTVKK
jgi:hypothetical protein